MRPDIFIESGDGSSSNWLGTARSLGQQGINVLRLSSRDWYSSKYCKTIISPSHDKPDEYLRFLIKIGKALVKRKERVGYLPLLMPSTDEGLTLISKNRRSLWNYFEATVPDWNCTEKIVNKNETYNFARSLKIPIPETQTPHDSRDVDRISRIIDYPCLIKPVFSHIFRKRFNIKLVKANSRKDLLRICNNLFRQGYRMLIQEEIPGGDDQVYMLDTCLNKRSESLAVFTMRKIRQYPPHFGVGSFVKSVWEPRIVDVGLEMLEKMHFYGIASIEFKRDPRTGRFVLLEINGRSHTQNYLATVCGVNLPHILYKDLMGEKICFKRDTCQFKQGISWIHSTIDFLSMVKKWRKRELTPKEWLQSILVGERTHAVFSADDLRPFISELKVIWSYLLTHGVNLLR